MPTLDKKNINAKISEMKKQGFTKKWWQEHRAAVAKGCDVGKSLEDLRGVGMDKAGNSDGITNGLNSDSIIKLYDRLTAAFEKAKGRCKGPAYAQTKELCVEYIKVVQKEITKVKQRENSDEAQTAKRRSKGVQQESVAALKGFLKQKNDLEQMQKQVANFVKMAKVDKVQKIGNLEQALLADNKLSTEQKIAKIKSFENDITEVETAWSGLYQRYQQLSQKGTPGGYHPDDEDVILDASQSAAQAGGQVETLLTKAQPLAEALRAHLTKAIENLDRQMAIGMAYEEKNAKAEQDQQIRGDQQAAVGMAQEELAKNRAFAAKQLETMTSEVKTAAKLLDFLSKSEASLKTIQSQIGKLQTVQAPVNKKTQKLDEFDGTLKKQGDALTQVATRIASLGSYDLAKWADEKQQTQGFKVNQKLIQLQKDLNGKNAAVLQILQAAQNAAQETRETFEEGKGDEQENVVTIGGDDEEVVTIN